MAKKVLPILFITLLLDTIGFGMVFPIIPIIFTDPTSPSFLLVGYSKSSQFFIAGAIIATFGLMQFLAAPILGELSDVYGRKRLLTVGVAVLAISQFLFGFGIHIGSVLLLFISRAFAGLSAANFSIAQATIADVTLPQNRAKNFGLIGAAFGIGFIIGPFLSGWLAGVTANPAVPFWTASAMGLFNVMFISLFLKETNLVRETEKHTFNIFKGLQNIRAAFDDKEALPLYITNFLYMSGFSLFVSFVGILLVSSFHFSETTVGTFFALIGVFVVVTQLFILRILAGRFSELAILRYSMLLVALAIVLFPFAPTVTFLFLLIPFMAIPQGLSMANLPALVSKSVSPAKQGAALGINSSLMALAGGMIPIIGGVGSGILGLQMPFIIGGLFILGAWSVLFILQVRRLV